MKQLAPVAISTYSRIDHLKRTVEALKKNTFAQDSELYIFSDGPRQGDDEKVAQVRDYIHTIDGFKSVHIVERETNSRTKNNRGGKKFLLEKYGKCIFLEEDIVTAPGYLAFMNGALDFYADDERVFSISGYTVPIRLPRSFAKDVFAVGRMNNWGNGLYLRTLEPLDKPIDSDEFYSIEDKSIFDDQGRDNIPHIIRQINGETDYGDVKSIYYQIINGLITVYPRQSLVRNIGNDGSGANMENIYRFNVDKLWDKTSDFVFEPNIKVDPRIQKRMTVFWDKGLWGLFIRILRKAGLYPVFKAIYGFLRNRFLPKNRAAS